LSSLLLVLVGMPHLLAQAPAGGAKGGAGGGDLFGTGMFPMLIMITGLMFYFMLMRPEQRKRKELEKQLKELKKNDHVVTSSGIVGTVLVASPESKIVTLRIDDSTGTKIRVLRSAIAYIGDPEAADTDAKSEKASG
jgi:preprotein translocase subunit YajC